MDDELIRKAHYFTQGNFDAMKRLAKRFGLHGESEVLRHLIRLVDEAEVKTVIEVKKPRATTKRTA